MAIPTALRSVLRYLELSPLWQARLLAMSVRLCRSGRRFDDSAADKALAHGELAEDKVGIGYALHQVSVVRLRQRDTLARCGRFAERWRRPVHP